MKTMVFLLLAGVLLIGCAGSVPYGIQQANKTGDTLVVPVDINSCQNYQELALAVHCHINVERESAGVRTLKYDRGLEPPARVFVSYLQSEVENAGGQIIPAHLHDSHTQGSCSFKCRLRRSEAPTRGVGEIWVIVIDPTIANASTGSVAQRIVREWKNSPEHRRKMLGSRSQRQGIAVIRKGDGAVYASSILAIW